MVSGKGKAAVNVLVERKSRKVRLMKLARKTSSLACNAVIDGLSRLPRMARLSITYDNGSENVEHETVNEALGTKSYFCAPFHSWEKGSVENRIGIVRRDVPKGANIDLLTESDVKRIERRINNRPMRCLNYETPAEVFAKLCGALPD